MVFEFGDDADGVVAAGFANAGWEILVPCVGRLGEPEEQGDRGVSAERNDVSTGIDGKTGEIEVDLFRSPRGVVVRYLDGNACSVAVVELFVEFVVIEFIATAEFGFDHVIHMAPRQRGTDVAGADHAMHGAEAEKFGGAIDVVGVGVAQDHEVDVGVGRHGGVNPLCALEGPLQYPRYAGVVDHVVAVVGLGECAVAGADVEDVDFEVGECERGNSREEQQCGAFDGLGAHVLACLGVSVQV